MLRCVIYVSVVALELWVPPAAATKLIEAGAPAATVCSCNQSLVRS